MDYRTNLYNPQQVYNTYLKLENVQTTQKPFNPYTKKWNPQNIKPNKNNSLSYGSEVVPPFDNNSKGIPHMDHLSKEYPPYYAPFETGTSTFNHRLFCFTKLSI
jgi:hypothetical protein